MLALPASVPLVDPFTHQPPDYYYLPSGPTILLPGWPAPEVGLTPEPAPFFAHDHTGWQLIPTEQAHKARLILEKVSDHVVNLLTGQETPYDLMNAMSQFERDLRRLAKTGDEKPQPRKQVNPFQHIDKSRPMASQHDLIEGKRLAEALYNLVGLDVEPTCQVYRAADYRYRLHPDPKRGDGIEFERLRPDMSGWLKCPSPAFDRLGVEIALADLKGQYEEIVNRTRRPRFAHVVDEQGHVGQVVIEKGPVLQFNAADPAQKPASGKAADLIAQFNKDVYKAGETEFKRALGGLHVKQ